MSKRPRSTSPSASNNPTSTSTPTYVDDFAHYNNHDSHENIYTTKRHSPNPTSSTNQQTPAAGPAGHGVMRCSLPPHKTVLSFSSYEDYEVHYLQSHVNRCAECGKNFPTGRFLDLHIEENHDSLAVARRARGEKTYGCFVDGCDRKCSTPQKRRMHLIDKHMFPRTYDFHVIDHGIDRQTSMLRTKNTNTNQRRPSSMATQSASQAPREGRLRHRRLSTSQSQTGMSVNAQAQAQDERPPPAPSSSGQGDIDELERSMAALRFVPASVLKNRR